MKFQKAVRKTVGRITRHNSDKGGSEPLQRFVESSPFAILVCCVIIVASVCVGLETQLLAEVSVYGAGSDSLRALFILSVVNYVLTFFLLAEIVIRVQAYKRKFFQQDMLWNFFDVLILLLAVVEIAVEIVITATSPDGNSSVATGGAGGVKVLRILRLTRLLRLVKTFRQLRPLRMLCASILFAGRSVFWAFMLILMIIYVFGIILTQAVSEYVRNDDVRGVDNDALLRYFGDLPLSMMSLWMSVAEGISWHVLTESLAEVHVAYVAVFVVYIAFVYFAVLNVVTGVFCQNAIESAQHDLETTIETHLKHKQEYVTRLKALFDEMHVDADVGLSPAELQFHLEKPKVQSWFKALDIDPNQAWKIFQTQETNVLGLVELDDFVEGCLKFRGSATRLDVESMKWEIKKAKSTAARNADLIDKKFRELHAALQGGEFPAALQGVSKAAGKAGNDADLERQASGDSSHPVSDLYGREEGFLGIQLENAEVRATCLQSEDD